MSVPGADESWMDGLPAAEVIQQYGFDPNVSLTSEGKFELPKCIEVAHVRSDDSDGTSTSDGSSSESSGSNLNMADRRKLLKERLKAKIRKRAHARERGSTPAFKKRDFNFVKCGMVKMWLVDTGCDYDIVSKRETALIKRFVSKAKVPITFHTAHGPTRTENNANIHARDLDDNITPYMLENTPPVLTVGYICMDLGYT